MCNMKELSLLVWKLWLRLKFFKSRSNFTVKVENYGTMWKVLSQWLHIWIMKVLSLLVWKLWPRSKFLSRSWRRHGRGRYGYDIISPDIRPGSLKNYQRTTFNPWLLLVIRSVSDVLRAQSSLVKFVGVRPQAEPPTHFTTYFGLEVRQKHTL